MAHSFKTSGMWKQALIIAIVFSSCEPAVESGKHVGNEPAQQAVSSKDARVATALAFINAYTRNAGKISKATDVVDWVYANDLTTKAFKATLKRIMDEAYQQDPELGLGADPVFDAQDYPDKGFEADTFDAQTNYLTVKGIDWPAFRLTMKLANENGKWLVDGCGIVNIPVEKQAAR